MGWGSSSGYKTMSWVGPGVAGRTDRFAKRHRGENIIVEVSTAGLKMDDAKRKAYAAFLLEVAKRG